ncbi:Natural cytotoxicity triggering receptor 3 ligand 1 [Plecturocebus cupreus]
MGNQNSRVDPKSPLGCLVQNLPKLGLSIKKKKLVSLSTIAWPQYSLDNQSKWPLQGTFNFNVLTDLDNYCKKNSKWLEIPYVLAFWYLRSCPTLCSSCTTAQILLAKETSSSPLAPLPSSSSFSDPDAPEKLSFPLARPNPPPPYDRPQSPSAPLPPTHPPPDGNLAYPVSAHTRSCSAPSDEASLLCPLCEVAGAEGIVQVQVPFSLSDLSAIEKRLGSFSTNPTAYTKEFHYLTQAYHLTWHDTFVILSSTLTPDKCD